MGAIMQMRSTTPQTPPPLPPPYPSRSIGNVKSTRRDSDVISRKRNRKDMQIAQVKVIT